MKSLFILLAILLIPSIGRGATYYIDATGGSDANDGSLATPWQNLSKPNNLSVGDDIKLKRGETFTGTLNVNWNGTAANYVVIDDYGAGAKPIIDGSRTISTAWDRYGATSIYSTAMISNNSTNVYIQDDVRLKRIAWDTDIATTSAAMSAGTFAVDTDNTLVYLWTTDNSNASTKTIKSAVDDYGIRTTFDWPAYGKIYIKVANISLVNHDSMHLFMGNYYYNCKGSIVDNVDMNRSGSVGIRFEGEAIQFINNTCEDSGTETAGDVGCVVIGHANNGTVKNNIVRNTRYGTCYECNFWNDNLTFSNNAGYNCTHQFLEIWDNTTHSVFQNNFADSTGYSKRASQGVGIKITHGSSNNTIKNNIIIDTGLSAGVAVGAGTSGHHNNNDNLFYHNTIVTSGTFTTAGLAVTNDATGENLRNVFKNNIVKVATGRCIYSKNATTVFNNNDYYTGAGNLSYWLSSNYTNLSNHQAASSQDANSKEGDPALTTDYKIPKSSLAYDNGTNVGVTTDYWGNPRPVGVAPDIGSFEWYGSTASGVNITGLTWN